jgi:RNA polymerase subunit RPABC4/transcription elongation factor Spt4
MLYCENCKVSITGNHEKCPLCQGDVIGEPSKSNTFPIIREEKQIINLILKITALVTIAIGVICVLINIGFGGKWSIYVIAGIVTGWIVIWITVKMHGNITKNSIWLTIIISILSFVWDISTGYRGWSIDYVLPLICCFAMIEMFIVANIKKLKIEDYIVYLIIDILFGIIPLILLLLDVVNVVYPSLICVAESIISLAILILFEGKALKAEIVRRMHL